MIETPEVPVQDAATVVLMRDGSAGVEVWLLTRVVRMVFAAGMSVFPGGRVEEADASLPWAGRAAADFAADFGCGETLARALVGAAVRETFEETGVLLTTPPASLADHQADVESGRLSFGEFLETFGLAIDASALRPWAHWVTPPGERRRYDTRFFVAALPDGAEAIDLTSESSVAAWLAPGEALASHERGERSLLPPTIVTLSSMVAYSSVADVLSSAAGRSLEPVRPAFRDGPNGPSIELPDGTVYRYPGR